MDPPQARPGTNEPISQCVTPTAARAPVQLEVCRKLVGCELAKHSVSQLEQVCVLCQSGFSMRACTEVVTCLSAWSKPKCVPRHRSCWAVGHVSTRGMLKVLQNRPELRPPLPYVAKLYAALAAHAASREVGRSYVRFP